jgi:hypothetical protein
VIDQLPLYVSVGQVLKVGRVGVVGEVLLDLDEGLFLGTSTVRDREDVLGGDETGKAIDLVGELGGIPYRQRRRRYPRSRRTSASRYCCSRTLTGNRGSPSPRARLSIVGCHDCPREKSCARTIGAARAQRVVDDFQ